MQSHFQRAASLPVFPSMNGNRRINQHHNRFSLPPPLESSELIEQNKENIPISCTNTKQNNKRQKQNRLSAFDTVPPLELLSDENVDETSNNENQTKQINESTESKTSSEVIVSEECEESGDVIMHSNDVQSTSNVESPNTTNSSLSYSISSTGRLLESEQDWQRRPKVTHGGADGRSMIFRPLRMKCTHCEEAYMKTHDLYAHIRSHQNHTKCPHCGKILTCMATFVYHVRTHTAEKPYYCPCEGCDFKNAVKYNLKVHLACIRHGGKDNLKKYAKVLDLDVCEKSLRKRKDNSVHELGSRRSKRRRKMNNDRMTHDNTTSQITHTQQQHYYPKQEECDQFAAQLLFSLSGIPPMFDQNMSLNQGMMDWSSIVGHGSNNNIIKSEQAMMDHENKFLLKPEYYDPLYGYYGFTASANISNTVNAMSNSLSTSTIFSEDHGKIEIKKNINDHNHSHNHQLQNDANSDGILIPKQEPVYPLHSDYHTHGSYLNANAPNPYCNQQMQHYYYANAYYYDPSNPNMALYNTNPNPNINGNPHQTQTQENENKNKTFELPPLQFSEFEISK